MALTSSTSSSKAASRYFLPAVVAVCVLSAILYLVSDWMASPIAAALGDLIVRLGRGRIDEPATFVAELLREGALLFASAALLAVGSVVLCRRLFTRLAGVARWTTAALLVYGAFSVWVLIGSKTMLFWATLYFGGPNLMQSAYHFERILALQSDAPTKVVILGSSQAGSQIHGGRLNEIFGPDVRFAVLAYAGTDASEFLIESDMYQDVAPKVVIVYINESNFYQGVSGSRYLPFLTPARLSHVWRSGTLELGARDRFHFAVVGMVLPLFHVRQAVEFFLFGFQAGNRDFPSGPSAGASPTLEDRAAVLARAYRVDASSDLQKREFQHFLDHEIARGSTPVILIGQVNPVLEEQIDKAVRQDFAAYVEQIARRYPDSIVLNDLLPRHTAEQYAAADLMHLNQEARLAFTDWLADVLSQRFGWGGRAGSR